MTNKELKESIEKFEEEAKKKCLEEIKADNGLDKFIEGYKLGYRDGYSSAIKDVNEQIKNQGGADGAKPGWWWWPWR
jgi:hypothetical protein